MNVFSKPAKRNSELIQEWEKRGLAVPDKDKANRYLDFIGYYRLSAYTIPFQIPLSPSHQFKPDTTFDDVLQLYIFDRQLRLLIMDAIERIEISVRAQISNVLALAVREDGVENGAFWYTDTRHFTSKFSHMQLLAGIEKQCSEERQKLERDINHLKKRKLPKVQEQERIVKIQKENFLRHYLSQYTEPKLPPCWMVFELLTWGQLSHLYAGLASPKAKKEIAQNLGVNAEILESWLKSFNSIRNFCAHHSRLWNRELGVSIKIPQSKQIKWLQTSPSLPGNIAYGQRIYSIVVAIQVILYTISPHSGWGKRFKELLDLYPDVSLVNMGIPPNWYDDEFWQSALA